jgi:NAD(P)H-dependent FMN reductase
MLVSGSTRGASTNTAALRTARALAPDGVRADLYEGLADLPAFNPDADADAGADGRDAHAPAPHPAVTELRARLTAADAVLFCTPEYAGALPGSFKNLLDWTVGGGELYGKPAAWISVAAAGRGTGAHAELATVLGYVSAEVLSSACVSLPVARQAVDAGGLVTDEDVRAGIVEVLRTIALAVGSAAPA